MKTTSLRSACAVVATAGAALASAPAPASVPLEVKVISGVQAPGAQPGWILDGLMSAVVNEAGELAFMSHVGDPQGISGGTALFGPDADGVPTFVTSDFVQVPGMPPDTQFRFVETYHPRLDDAGDVAFQAYLSGPGIDYPTDASGIWRWRAETGLDLVVRAGDPVPGAGPGMVFGPIRGTLTLPAIGPDGAIAFHALFGEASNPWEHWGGFVADPEGIETLGRTGTPVPGIADAVLTTVYHALGGATGRWSFWSFFEGPGVVEGENDSASFVWDPDAGLSMQARTGDPAPATAPGVVLLRPYVYPSDGGGSACWTALGGPGVTEGEDSALYATDASGSLVKMLAREGHAAPGAGPDAVIVELVGDSVVINAAGQVVFTAAIAGPGIPPYALGMWRFDPATNALDLLVRSGDPAPGLPGLTIEGFWWPVLNDRGDIAFTARIAGPSVTSDSDDAIFASEDGATLAKVMREGDLASFGPGDLRPLLGPSMLGGLISDAPGARQLNDAGQLVFLAHTPTPEFTQAIVVATLPEPGVGTGLLCGVAALAGLRRRSTMSRWRRSPRTSCTASPRNTALPTTSTTPS